LIDGTGETEQRKAKLMSMRRLCIVSGLMPLLATLLLALPGCGGGGGGQTTGTSG